MSLRRWNDARLIHFFVTLSLFLISFWLQENVFLNWDVSWHLLGGERMLHGAGYLTGVFDDNPPMVFWLSIPIVLIAHYFSVSLISAQIIFVLLIVLSSYLLSDRCLKLYCANRSRYTYNVMRYTLLIVILFFQLSEFGQREMLLTLLTLPYVLLMCVRLAFYNSRELGCSFLILIGFSLGIGIALNPLYGLIFLALEIQYALSVKKRSYTVSEFLTADRIVFLLFCSLYLMAIACYYPAYFTVIIPVVFVFSPGFNASLSLLLLNFPNVLFLVVVICFLLVRFEKEDQSWLTPFFTAAVISYFIYLMNGKSWYYHLYPCVTFSFLYLIFFLLLIFKEKGSVASFEKVACSVLGVFGIIGMLFFGAIVMIVSYQQYHDKEYGLNRMIQFFKAQPIYHPSLYFFSTRLDPAFPLISYLNVRYLPGWPDCWLIPMSVRNQAVPVAGWRMILIKRYEKQFMLETISDFQDKKPDYVVVDEAKKKPYMEEYPFDYIAFLSRDVMFQKIWKQYHLVKKIGDYGIYKKFMNKR